MINIKVYIRGGVCEDVKVFIGGAAVGAFEYAVIDYDNLECGACPYCGSENIDVEAKRCNVCSADWVDDDIDEAAEREAHDDRMSDQ